MQSFRLIAFYLLFFVSLSSCFSIAKRNDLKERSFSFSDEFFQPCFGRGCFKGFNRGGFLGGSFSGGEFSGGSFSKRSEPEEA